MASTADNNKLSLKLLIDRSSNKVLFAEAGKDVVDFLFNILALPMGTIIRLLKEEGMVGCLGNVYNSVDNLSETYVQPSKDKNLLLKPVAPICVAENPILLTDEASPPPKTFYTCSRQNDGSYNYQHHFYVSEDSSASCPKCGKPMSSQLTYVDPPQPQAAKVVGGTGAASASSGEGGYVKGVVTYMVMDDLVVKPMSTISSITLLNQFKVMDLGSLEEKAVDLDLPKGLKLLRVSLQSKTVLTEVFLGAAEGHGI